MCPVQKPRKCKYCNTTVVFAKTGEGKTVPLDVSAPMYKVYFHSDETTCERVRGNQGRPGDPEICFGVTHFATCRGVERAKADQEKKKAGA